MSRFALKFCEQKIYLPKKYLFYFIYFFNPIWPMVDGESPMGHVWPVGLQFPPLLYTIYIYTLNVWCPIIEKGGVFLHNSSKNFKNGCNIKIMLCFANIFC